MVSTFDPAAHLSKQGWKGKGTALKQGHATRPLAVVQKKTLSGIGKDRDEAVPFWDQIFAATAASIFSSPAGSGASSPIPQRAAHNTTRDWMTTSYSAPVSGNSTPTQLTVKPKNGGAPSTQARIGKEMARKGLYSRFLRGKTIVVEPEPGPEEEAVAGPSTLVGVVEEVPKGKRKREGETKEERRARRAEKARRKTEKAAASTTMTEPLTKDQPAESKKAKGEGKKKKRRTASEEAELEVKSEEAKAEELTKRKKEKKRKAQAESHAESGKETAEVVHDSQDPKAERKKKRRKAEV